MIKNVFLKYTIIFLSVLAAVFAFSVLVCCLPDRAVKKHVEQIAPVIYEQGQYPQAIIQQEVCRQDNFTDALILNQMYSVDRTHPLKSAMSVSHSDYDMPYDMIGPLLRVTSHESGYVLTPYFYYWHGNTFFFRLLMCFMDYYTLQWLMYVVSSLLLVLFLCTYYVRAGMMKTLAFLFSWLLVYGFVPQFSMQLFSAPVLTLIASLLVVHHSDDSSYLSTMFFVIACLICYFDLLTTPLLTFAMPLIVWISLQDSAVLRTRDSLMRMCGWGLLWLCAYVLMYIAKWGIGSLVLGTNVWEVAYGAGLHRVGTGDFTRWDGVVRNVHMLSWAIILILTVGLLIYSLLRFSAASWFKAVLLLLVAIMPYVWYFLLSNHSYNHFWFTYRLQAVTVAALFMAILCFRRQGRSEL